MRIRPASVSDHPALAELFLQVRREIFTWQDSASFRLDDFAIETEGEVIHLAENEEGRLLGFISVWEPENFVHHLFIAGNSRGTGIGKALLSELGSRDPGPFRLKCVEDNSNALAFYRRLGWTVIGRGESDDRPYLLMESARHPHDRLHDRSDDPHTTGQNTEGAGDAAALHRR